MLGWTILGVHQGGRRLNIIARGPWHGRNVIGIGSHRKTMMSHAVHRSVMVGVGGKLTGVIDWVRRWIRLNVVGGEGGHRPRAGVVIIFIWRAGRPGRAPAPGI